MRTSYVSMDREIAHPDHDPWINIYGIQEFLFRFAGLRQERAKPTLSRLELKNCGHIFLGYGRGPSCQKAKERIDESSSGAALTTVCVPINELPSELPLPPPPPKEHYEK